MKPLRRGWRRLIGVVSSVRDEQRMADEFESHIELLAADLERAGMSAEEARRQARLKFGGMETSKEACREQRGLPRLEGVLRDIRYGLRGMRRNPGFTAVAMICLALGIGANTAIFSVVNAVMLRSLPVRDPDQLVLVRHGGNERLPNSVLSTQSGIQGMSFSDDALGYFRSSTRSFAAMAGYARIGFGKRGVTAIANRKAQVVDGEMVTGGYFQMLGVAPVLGRAIEDDDLRPGAPDVVLLSYAYWSNEFARDPHIVGATILLNGAPFTVVGVAPRDFFGLDPGSAPSIWTPLRFGAAVRPRGQPDSARLFGNPKWWWMMIAARVAPGVPVRTAQAELDAAFQQMVTARAGRPLSAKEASHIELLSAQQGLDFLRQTLSEPLHILLIATGVVLLIACANVAALLLARSSARRREMSIRLAIGATRGRLLRQFLTESVLLGTGGGALGMLLAYWGSRILMAQLPGAGDSGLNVRPDSTVLLFGLAVSTVTGIVFGLAPAWRAAAVDAGARLKETSGSIAPRQRTAKVLVALQVALSVLLLFGAGLFVRTLYKLETQEHGFRVERLLVFSLDGGSGGYQGDRWVSLCETLQERLQSIPGVTAATVVQNALLNGWVNSSNVATDGPPISAGQQPMLYWNLVGGDFLRTMEIPLAVGRAISREDVQARRRVAVISESAARFFFNGESPIGRHFSLGRKLDPAQQYEIVGVARDARYDSVRRDTRVTAYLPYTVMANHLREMYFEVRTAGNPKSTMAAIRRTVREIDANLPISGLMTQKELMETGLKSELLFARLTSAFGLLALVLVCVGLYGSLAYTVTRRFNEIGIRMALGARRSQVIWMVMRESLLLVGCGMAVGFPVAFLAMNYMTKRLYGVKLDDVWTIAATIASLVIAGTAAAFLPARRASRIDPMRALRYE